MNFISLIESKRDGQTLSRAQIAEVVQAYTQGEIPDYQMSAFLMAVYFRGLSTEETRALTLSMRDSGEKLTFPADPRPLVDKHSTGGVGDKVSLPLAPLLACLGFRVPMISGRGLGITGGTLDKLESIPGLRTALTGREIVDQVQSVGCVICGQTAAMVPADKKLYALRDVTATVPAIPLIVASILSKKLAEGISALVLDVKFGSGAFMPGLTQARDLAQAMTSLGRECGVRTRALLTRMDAPLGASVGNWLEVMEAVQCLEPERSGDATANLVQLVLTCAAVLLVETGKAATIEDGRELARTCLASGEPRSKWEQMVAAQGGDVKAFRQRQESLAPCVLEIHAETEGVITDCNARVIGEVVRDLGGGRLTQDSELYHDVGVDRMAQVGAAIQPGMLLGRVHARGCDQAQLAAARVRSAFEVRSGSRAPVPAAPLIHEVI